MTWSCTVTQRAERRHDLPAELEGEVGAVGADVEQHVTGRGRGVMHRAFDRPGTGAGQPVSAIAAGRIRSQYDEPNPTTQDSGPLPIAFDDCRKPTARTNALMSETTSSSRSTAPGRSFADTTRKTAASLSAFSTA